MFVALMSNGLMAVALGGVLTATGCNIFLPSQFQTNRVSQSAGANVSPGSRAQFQADWVGKDAGDLKRKFGPPSQMETLEDTGGQRYYYREPGQPHCVFELGPRGKVVSAALVD